MGNTVEYFHFNLKTQWLARFFGLVMVFCHRYLISQDCNKRKIWMQQIFNICWQMICCWFMLLMLYLPLLDICVYCTHSPRKKVSFCSKLFSIINYEYILQQVSINIKCLYLTVWNCPSLCLLVSFVNLFLLLIVTLLIIPLIKSVS